MWYSSHCEPLLNILVTIMIEDRLADNRCKIGEEGEGHTEIDEEN